VSGLFFVLTASTDCPAWSAADFNF